MRGPESDLHCLNPSNFSVGASGQDHVTRHAHVTERNTIPSTTVVRARSAQRRSPP